MLLGTVTGSEQPQSCQDCEESRSESGPVCRRGLGTHWGQVRLVTRGAGPGGELSQGREGPDQGDGGQQAGGVRQHGSCYQDRGRPGWVSMELFRFSINHAAIMWFMNWDEWMSCLIDCVMLCHNCVNVVSWHQDIKKMQHLQLHVSFLSALSCCPQQRSGLFFIAFVSIECNWSFHPPDTVDMIFD